MIQRFLSICSLAFALSLPTGTQAQPAPSQGLSESGPFDLLIANGRALDGTERVLVNGEFAVKDGEILYSTPGKVLTAERRALLP